MLRDSSTFDVFVFVLQSLLKIGWQHLRTLRKNKYEYNFKFHECTISHTSIIEFFVNPQPIKLVLEFLVTFKNYIFYKILHNLLKSNRNFDKFKKFTKHFEEL